VTEDVWSWWQEGSVHRTAWPTANEIAVDGDVGLLPAAAQVLSGIRGAKSNAKVSQKTEVTSATVRAPEALLGLLPDALADVQAAGNVTGALELVPADGDVVVEASLAE
jgi:valyl-tRNA synthetase